MAISLAMRRSLQALADDDTILWLVTIDHPDMAAPLRITRNAEAVVSGGQTFMPYPFNVGVPDAPDGDQEISCRFVADNFSREIVAQLWGLVGEPPSVLLQLVLAGDPDTIELGFPDLIMASPIVDRETISGTLELASHSASIWPRQLFGRFTWPGAW